MSVAALIWRWRHDSAGASDARAREAATARKRGLLGAAVGLAAAAVVHHFRPTAGFVVAGIALLFFLKRYSEWITTDFVLTSDRLIFRKGVLSRQGREIPLERINDISFHQGLFDRVIGAGDLTVESAGERGQETLRMVPRPEELQREIYRQMKGR